MKEKKAIDTILSVIKYVGPVAIAAVGSIIQYRGDRAAEKANNTTEIK